MIFSAAINRIREYDSLFLILVAVVAMWALTIQANAQYDPTLSYTPGDPDMIGSVPIIDVYADVTPKDVRSYWKVDTFCVSARVYNLECIEYTIDSTLISVVESVGVPRATDFIFATDTDCNGEPDRWDNNPRSCQEAEEERRLCIPLPKGSVVFKDDKDRDQNCLPAQTPKH